MNNIPENNPELQEGLNANNLIVDLGMVEEPELFNPYLDFHEFDNDDNLNNDPPVLFHPPLQEFNRDNNMIDEELGEPPEFPPQLIHEQRIIGRFQNTENAIIYDLHSFFTLNIG